MKQESLSLFSNFAPSYKIEMIPLQEYPSILYPATSIRIYNLYHLTIYL